MSSQCHLVLTLPFDVTHFKVVMFIEPTRRLESRRGKHECSRHVVAHALLRAVSALLPRPLESNICASALKLRDIGLRVRATRLVQSTLVSSYGESEPRRTTM